MVVELHDVVGPAPVPVDTVAERIGLDPDHAQRAREHDPLPRDLVRAVQHAQRAVPMERVAHPTTYSPGFTSRRRAPRTSQYASFTLGRRASMTAWLRQLCQIEPGRVTNVRVAWSSASLSDGSSFGFSPSNRT